MYDLAVIGLGPAGLEAVDIALRNKLNIIAFEKDNLGGTCLNMGCIPLKSVLFSSNTFSLIKKSKNLGINSVVDPEFNWQQIIDRAKNIISKFNKVLNTSISKNACLINANAQLLCQGSEIYIQADDKIYQAKNIIIATGSKPIELNNLKRDGKYILNSDDMLLLNSLPKTMAIVGSGAVGLEWAKILSDLGTKVFLIEKASSLAPTFDVDIQKRIERILKENKIDFYKNDYITSFNNNIITLNSNKTINVEKVLVAVGRMPVLPKIYDSNSEEDIAIEIQPNYSTQFKNVYVAGDANRECMLAHAGAFQAKVIMDKILGNVQRERKTIPSVVYITPEIASLGLREQDINKEEYFVKKVPMAAIAKSWCDECSDGFVKVIVKDNKIKGAHVVSKDASLLISLFSVFIDKQIDTDEISDFIFPHPCLAEIIYEVLKK